MSRIEDAFNHAARMSDPVKVAKERERFIEQLRQEIAREMFVTIERQMFEAFTRPRYDERIDRLVYDPMPKVYPYRPDLSVSIRGVRTMPSAPIVSKTSTIGKATRR